MRKMKMLVAFLVMLLMLTNGNMEIAKADGKEYSYRVVQDGETTRKAWFVNGEEITGNPGIIELDSQIYIEVTPDEECADYLANEFESATSRVNVSPDVTVTFGSSTHPTSIQGITCDRADVTIYAKDGEYDSEGFLDGSVYGVTVYNSNLTFYGNIQYLNLGTEYRDNTGVQAENPGNVTVNGHVYDLCWCKTTVSQSGDKYRGYTGNASVSGTVGNLRVLEIKHSNTLNADLKAETGNGYGLESFAMTNGVLSDKTNANVNVINPNLEDFYFELTPQDGENGIEWFSVARYLTGGETGIAGIITDAEAKQNMVNGAARINMERSTTENIDLAAYKLAELKVYRGTVTAGSVTTDAGNGLLQIHSYATETIGVKVNGNVDNCSISFTRFNQNMNIDVDGTIECGAIYKASLQTDKRIPLGTFSCTDMWIMKDGIWNPALFLSLGNAEYHPVDDSILDNLLDLQKNVQQAAGEISEMADMVVTEMNSDALSGLEKDEKFQSAVNGYEDTKVLTGVEIELSTFDYNETTKEVTNKQEVTELDEGKDLSFTVKVPENQYDPNKSYIIVREHENKDGSKSMEVLEPTRDGDKLTFKTNKFSSFTIVETAPDEIQETEGIGSVKSAYLKLEDSIAIVYEGAVLKSELADGNVPTARFTYRNETTTVSGVQLDDVVKDGETYAVYQFECRDILPQYADEIVEFELLLNGNVIASLDEYSVKEYCANMLGETAGDLGYSETKTARFRELLVNMLYYADAVKNYQGMNQTLTADLTDEYKAYHTTGAISDAQNQLNLTGSKNDPYCFTNASLVLEDKVNVQITFAAVDTENLSLKINFGGSDTVYTANEFESLGDNKYAIKFDKINATQYDTPLTASFYKDGEQQTQVLTYSVGTYISRSIDSAPENLKNVLTEMYEFGQAAKNYVSAQ